MSASALYVGSVHHHRHRPRSHDFRYRTFHLLVDVDELPELDRAVVGFGYRRPALSSFHDVDHFGGADLPTRAKLRRSLLERGITLPSGPLRVLTGPRVLGHVFNPVSWWFCHEPDGRLAMVVAEVNNTFGQTHLYPLTELLHDGADGPIRATASKQMRVSPFLPVDGLEYEFVFLLRERHVRIHTVVRDGTDRVLDAVQVSRRRELTRFALLAAVAAHPLTPVLTLGRIHWQALRLWLRGVPYLGSGTKDGS